MGNASLHDAGTTGAIAGDRAGAERRLLVRRFGLVGVVAAFGFLLAVTNASTNDWYWINASTLGIDPGARVYFNLTMVSLGFLFIGVSMPLRLQLAGLRSRGLISRRWAAAYGAGLLAIPLGLVGVGVFHIGGAKLPWLLHDIAGFLIPLVVMAMMLTLHWAVPALHGRFERRTLLIVGAIVGLFVLAVLEAISYSMMEIVSFVICWAWLFRYALHVDALLGRVPASPAFRGLA